MKKAQLTIDKIREGMTSFQKELLQEIWQYYCTKDAWPTIRELCSEHGTRKVNNALATMGKGVGSEDNSGSRWKRYQLSLLGVLLTKDGQTIQGLLVRFFQFQRELFKEEPKKDLSTSVEIANALKLSPDETALLGKLLYLGSFSGGYGGSNKEWSASAMEDAANFPKTGDLSVQVDKWACRYYQPKTLAAMQHPLEFPSELVSVQNLSGAPINQPHFSEIAVSLKRLREKYPDSTKLGFLIMRFADGKPFQRIAQTIKRTAEKHGLVVIRADENQFHAHLWENVRTLLHGCGFGIAIYERIEKDEPNANVGLEVGYLMAMDKPVLLLKDKSVKALQSDLAGRLYRNFDQFDPEKTIPQEMTSWLADNGIIVPNKP